MGITDKLIWGFEQLFGDPEGFEKMKNFLSSIGLKRVVYQGQHRLEGNACNKLLKSIDRLELYLKQEGKGLQGAPLIAAFRSFNDVVESCFGKSLSPDYEAKIQRFSLKYRETGLTVSVKVHIVETHTAEFINFKGSKHGNFYIGFLS